MTTKMSIKMTATLGELIVYAKTQHIREKIQGSEPE